MSNFEIDRNRINFIPIQTITDPELIPQSREGIYGVSREERLEMEAQKIAFRQAAPGMADSAMQLRDLNILTVDDVLNEERG